LGECVAVSFIDDLVFKCIDETLAGVMGSLVRDALYLRLLTKYSLTREEIPQHLEIFDQILTDNFGPRAGGVLSRAIAKRLYSELQLPFVEYTELGLREYVTEAKAKLLDAKSGRASRLDNKVKTKQNGRVEGDDDCS